MAKQATKDYKAANRAFYRGLATNSELTELDGGVYYKALSSAEGVNDGSEGAAVSVMSKSSPILSDVVTVHYEGRLVNGYVFDSTYGGYAETFRVREVIEGWQIALQKMQVGDKWEIYIPKDLAYGDKKSGDIPGGSTLIFVVELLAIN